MGMDISGYLTLFRRFPGSFHIFLEEKVPPVYVEDTDLIAPGIRHYDVLADTKEAVHLRYGIIVLYFGILLTCGIVLFYMGLRTMLLAVDHPGGNIIKINQILHGSIAPVKIGSCTLVGKPLILSSVMTTSPLG